MFDFFGSIPMEDRAVAAHPQPFKHLRGIDKVQSRECRLAVDGQQWWVLQHERETNIFEDEQVVILLHGNCYPVSCNNEKAPARKLLPRELRERYGRSGREMIRALKGSFVIIVIDRLQKRLEIFTDPLNIRTVFYTSRGGTLLVSTSLTAIANYLADIGSPIQPDRRAILDLYLFDFTLDDHTYLKDVRELGPGAQMDVSNGILVVSTWFDPFRQFNLHGRRLNRKDGAALVKETLSDNIRLYNEGSEHTAVALTGGFDSRSIVALLKDTMSAFTFFSYGAKESWDVKIPRSIADRLNLSYQAICLDDEYRSLFSEYSKLAVLLSDGTAEFSHANIPYVYANFLRDKSSILTGLFGSELIKIPSSRGLFMDTNMIALLSSKNPADTMRSIFDQMDASGIVLPFADKETREETIDMIRRHSFISNDLPANEKYFYYLLMVGVRKYFRKETKIQRFWKINLHPFFDVEFVTNLLETPFPWVYNFSYKKSLVRNISIHKIYGSIINENRVLGEILSTHGYRPRHLENVSGIPMLALEYLRNKKHVSAVTTLRFQQDLALREADEMRDSLFRESTLDAEKSFSRSEFSDRNRVKIASLQFWLQSVGLSI